MEVDPEVDPLLALLLDPADHPDPDPRPVLPLDVRAQRRLVPLLDVGELQEEVGPRDLDLLEGGLLVEAFL